VTFSTLLVANRGEIARRVIRGAHSMGIRCVGVYVDADADAPFVGECDESIRLTTSYLDSAGILDAATRSGAQALHPGYGFLSENAEFAAQVEAAGLVWVGPSANVIAQMGDKLAAKEMARAAGVPTLPSRTDPGEAGDVGYPLMVKAVGGGGGKGMRIVTDPSQLDEAVESARREAAGGFGDDRIFLERYVASSRHIEIQILGDLYGNLVHLGERECSIQRRHQKLIEESPSPFMDDEMRVAMTGAALALGRVLGYQSAGTVEFLVDNETREFYFLEVNTRLQVEHPVSEEVTDIDLVREQLRIAAGEPLGYEQDDVVFEGHAIEIRLCAEDPGAGFLPATGTLVAFEPAREPMVRWESGVEEGSVVSFNFDPLLAKVIAFAPTRTEAASTLSLALEGLHVGGVTTNRDFLVTTLRDEHFLAGETTTDFIERYEPSRSLTLTDHELSWTSTAAALWLQGESRANASVLAHVPSGWRNARLPRQRTELRWNDQNLVVDYRSRRDGGFDVGTDGYARMHRWNEREIDLEFNGRRATRRVTRTSTHLYVQSVHGTVPFEIVARFVVPGVDVIAGGLTAPMPGLVIDVRVSPGQHVGVGETLVVMEAMKMEHVISAPSAGIVHTILVTTGQQVDNGAILLTMESSQGAQEVPGTST
jgi:propionyl-CoA carboxylase alpha chain